MEISGDFSNGAGPLWFQLTEEAHTAWRNLPSSGCQGILLLAIPAGTWAPRLCAPTAPSAVSIEARFPLGRGSQDSLQGQGTQRKLVRLAGPENTNSTTCRAAVATDTRAGWRRWPVGAFGMKDSWPTASGPGGHLGNGNRCCWTHRRSRKWESHVTTPAYKSCQPVLKENRTLTREHGAWWTDHDAGGRCVTFARPQRPCHPRSVA